MARAEATVSISQSLYHYPSAFVNFSCCLLGAAVHLIFSALLQQSLHLMQYIHPIADDAEYFDMFYLTGIGI